MKHNRHHYQPVLTVVRPFQLPIIGNHPYDRASLGRGNWKVWVPACHSGCSRQVVRNCETASGEMACGARAALEENGLVAGQHRLDCWLVGWCWLMVGWLDEFTNVPSIIGR